MRHRVEAGRPKLEVLMSKHVDDLKCTGVRESQTTTLQKVECVFGKLKIEWHNFTNCGVRHRQDPHTKEVILDQIEYASSLRLIAHSEMSTKAIDDMAGEELHE